MDKNEKMPENRFRQLDELEQKEHLDQEYNLPDGTKPFIDPVTAMPYNAMFAFPCTATGFPAASPYIKEDWDITENKNTNTNTDSL